MTGNNPSSGLPITAHGHLWDENKVRILEKHMFLFIFTTQHI